MTSRFLWLVAAGAVAATQPVLAQAPYPEGNPGLAAAPRLATPPVSSDAGARSFLMAARSAVLIGRTGEAEEALERAETRLLDRPVPPEAVNGPDRDRAVLDIGAARRSLVARDHPATVRAIDDAMLALEPAPAPTGAAQPPSVTSLRLPPLLTAGAPQAATLPASPAPVAPPAPPQVTYALLPGHWQPEGAHSVWVPPETSLRRVTDKPRVGALNVSKSGRWVLVPQHDAGADGN
jgi:hypothetical protein